MRLVIQRVSSAKVTVYDQIVGQIGPGALVLFGAGKGDTADLIPYLVEKLTHLRFFHDDEGKMNRSLLDEKKEILVVSQFTLYANCKSGRRPSFTETAPPEEAEKLYEGFASQLKKTQLNIQTGRFGAYMQVSLVNDGPVTLILEKEN